MMFEKKCFVIMPFSKELHYFYLYLQGHIQKKYKIKVERADATIQADSLWDKIKNQIEKADFLIVDITGCNLNVFFELGYARAKNKRTIILTRDSAKDAPTDIQYLEKIEQKDDPESFIKELDKAIDNVVLDETWFYSKGLKILEQFRKDTGIECQSVTEEDFKVLLQNTKIYEVPDRKDEKKLKLLLLPLIIKDRTSPLMETMTKWLSGD